MFPAEAGENPERFRVEVLQAGLCAGPYDHQPGYVHL